MGPTTCLHQSEGSPVSIGISPYHSSYDHLPACTIFIHHLHSFFSFTIINHLPCWIFQIGLYWIHPGIRTLKRPSKKELLEPLLRSSWEMSKQLIRLFCKLHIIGGWWWMLREWYTSMSVCVCVLVFVSNYKLCAFLGTVQPFDTLVLISFCFVECAAVEIFCEAASHPTLNLVRLPQPPTTKNEDSAFFSWCPALIAICFSNSAILSFFSFHKSEWLATCNLTASKTLPSGSFRGHPCESVAPAQKGQTRHTRPRRTLSSVSVNGAAPIPKTWMVFRDMSGPKMSIIVG